MIIRMLQKFTKIRSNSEQAENTKSAETQKNYFSKRTGRKYRLA